MTTQSVTRTIRLSPEESQLLKAASKDEYLPEGTLVKKWVLEGLARYRLERACEAYAHGELDLGSAARYADVSLYEMMAELHRRGIETTTFEQIVDGLATLVESFGEEDEVTRRAIAELRRIAAE